MSTAGGTRTEAGWVTTDAATALLGVTRQELHRRTRLGDPDFIVSKLTEDGRRLYCVASMHLDARTRYRDSRLATLATPKPAEIESACAGPGQGSFFPVLDADKKAAARIPSQSERDVAFRRKRIVDLCLNHNWKAEGYNSKSEFLKALAERNETSQRSIQRWLWQWKQRESLEDLIKDRPGPEPGTGAVLDADMRSHLHTCWLQGLTPRQCYRSLKSYLEGKQNTPGCRADHRYRIPSFATVARFLRSLDALDDAARDGPDALKAACGHIDRSYLDLAPLERVENDECKLNLFSFDPRRAVNRKGEPWIRRYWLLTFYDARSMFPLVWSLCEGSEYELRRGIAVEDEINLFVALVRGFGVPDAIHSDRGRFRGREWGGEPFQQRIDKEFAPVNGILQRVGLLVGMEQGIRHDMPRVHNPRGTRLERFHRWVADWFRGTAGWIGANTRERKMTRGDADAERHKLWCIGKLALGEHSPLLTRDEVLAEVNTMMEAWREHNSDGTDMNGLTPRAVFVQCSPSTGFRRISNDDLAFATAEHFQNEHIETGGIIELRDGSRYSHPLLAGLAGQKREVGRLRHDHSFVTVLPARKGEKAIRADRRVRVGMKDPDELACQMEAQNRLNKLAGEFVRPLEYDPGAAIETRPEGAPPTPDREMSGAEYLAEGRHAKRPPRGLGFAGLED